MDDFIINLYCLAKHCEYGNLHNKLVRDRIVVGIRDRKLSEKLMLEEAVTKVRQSKAIRKQQSTVRADG